jgi:hypothetical protein
MRSLLAALRRLGSNLALVAISVGATVAIFELGARVLVPEWTPKHAERKFWAYHERLGWGHQLHARARHRHRDFSVTVSTNSMGFRDRDYPLDRVPGRKRMFFLGDSFGFGFGVEHDEMMTSILETRYPHWEIINTAVSGWGTDQQLLLLREVGRDFRPDVVLLLFHPNDVEDNNAAMRYGYHKPQFVLEGGELVLTNVPVPQLNRDQRIDRLLHQRTYVLHKVWNWRKIVGGWLDEQRTLAEERRALAAAVGSPKATDQELATPDVSAPPPEQAAPRDRCRGRNLDFTVSRALLTELDAEVRSLGARLAVVSVPGRCPDPRELLAPLLIELGVPYRPLDETFSGISNQEWKFPNDPHWNATGQRMAADATEAFLLEVDILP